MELSLSPLIYLSIFGAVLLLIQGIYLMVFGKSIEHSSKLNRRLDLIEKGRGKKDVMEQLRKERSTHSRKYSIPIYGLIQERARKGNIAFSPNTLILLMFALSVFSFVMLTLASDTEVSARIALSILFGFGGVFFWISSKAKKRVNAIEEQLPEAIDLMVRSLRVGHPFVAALSIASEEVADPLGSELGLIADEVSYGRDAGEAIADFGERVDLQDLRFLAVAVSIQSKSGGNLAEILDGLSKVVRSRFKLFRRVRAITAEAKWSGMFLSVFPIAAMIMIQAIKPDYYDDVKETPLYMPLAVVVCIFLIVNVLYMRKMTAIKV
ncbi:type II secretion system F family protein [Roseinatronobacter bogoriensis]|uniref:Pilus assembly protein TadB n=1 Tax=Roseinatronobacter bogoriensis subsp. barguzinensis TaxID=441209 RepID=A0A2K8KCY5_9RHOB|nr:MULTISPECIES: type II secretion system F family protein [Rhodobaca]ATX66826.1 pilus assembly protein TadB [Rhodobaca barguzinensis]MBB4206292.1 tight adherence protein B [Rhodobaca bogoriensis DSM 18756]TDW41037.1 tight adherence protein B [Rhodobaca barguzinensis]TDY74785.1 tight adherence protein B [Rhodobaca bogoriensis DSM 18756]